MSTNPEGIETFPPPEEPRRRISGWSCCLIGCAVLLGLGLLVTGFLLIGAWRMTDGIMEEIPTEPRLLEPVQASPREIQEGRQRFRRFEEALEDGSSDEAHLVLTEDELNGLLDEEFRRRGLAGGVRTRLVEDGIQTKFSLPLDPLPLGLGRGRYVNGSARLEVRFEDGRLFVGIEQMELNGRRLGLRDQEELRGVNLAEGLYRNPVQARRMSRIREVQLREGKLILVVAPPGDAE